MRTPGRQERVCSGIVGEVGGASQVEATMESLEHDPKAKVQIKDALHAFLYGPVTKQFKDRIESLINRNTVIGGYSHKHFIYKGIVYSADVTPPPMKKNRLVAQLRGEMDEYLRDLEHINNKELPYVMGFITQVLNSSHSLVDYLKVLPESVHAPIHQLLATCPCRMGTLSPETACSMQAKNAAIIDMMKQRLVTNLLI